MSGPDYRIAADLICQEIRKLQEDADRLQRAEELLEELHAEEYDERIAAFLGERND